MIGMQYLMNKNKKKKKEKNQRQVQSVKKLMRYKRKKFILLILVEI